MLLSGLNHVAVLTGDTERFLEFYEGVFDATHRVVEQHDGFRVTIVWIGPTAEINVFEIAGNTEHEHQVPMFGRGRVDHIALEATSIETFDVIRDRLLERHATDGFVTDFGHVLSVFFRDPDGLEAEVVVQNPDRVPGVFHPPGTPSRRFHPEDTPPPERVRDRPLPG